jgi:hypothetical protein
MDISVVAMSSSPPLQDARCGAVVQLAVNYSERLGLPGDAPSFGPIQGEFPSINLGEVLGPQYSAWGPALSPWPWLRRAIPLEQGEYERLV